MRQRRRKQDVPASFETSWRLERNEPGVKRARRVKTPGQRRHTTSDLHRVQEGRERPSPILCNHHDHAPHSRALPGRTPAPAMVRPQGSGGSHSLRSFHHRLVSLDPPARLDESVVMTEHRFTLFPGEVEALFKCRIEQAGKGQDPLMRCLEPLSETPLRCRRRRWPRPR